MDIYIITENDIEYGQPIFIDIATSEEQVLEICKKDESEIPLWYSKYDYYVIGFNERKDQVGYIDTRENKFIHTLYDVEKREI